MAQRQTATGHDQTNDELYALRMSISRIATHGQGIGRSTALEVAARQIVQQQVEGFLEQRPQARLQVALDCALVGQQAIQCPVQPVFVDLLRQDAGQLVELCAGIEALLNG